MSPYCGAHGSMSNPDRCRGDRRPDRARASSVRAIAAEKVDPLPVVFIDFGEYRPHASGSDTPTYRRALDPLSLAGPLTLNTETPRVLRSQSAYATV